MLGLVGAAIFHGSFYHQVHIAQYRQEFLITGARADEVRAGFILSCDVREIEERRDWIARQDFPTKPTFIFSLIYLHGIKGFICLNALAF